MKSAGKILVCDDDVSILDVIDIALTEYGYNVKTLTPNQPVLDIICEFKPDLIMLDLWMPGIEGSHLAKIIKKDSDLKHIPIIVISAMTDTAKIAKQMKVEGYLPKPFSLADLTALVRKWVN